LLRTKVAVTGVGFSGPGLEMKTRNTTSSGRKWRHNAIRFDFDFRFRTLAKAKINPTKYEIKESMAGKQP
jgi:hypothetical protein